MLSLQPLGLLYRAANGG